MICSPLKNQCINEAKGLEQFKTLKLADSNIEGTDLPIGILIGADHYHKFFTGRTVHSEVGTIASETVVGWVLSGPVPNSPPSNSLDTTNMRCFVEEPRDSNYILRQELNNFWNVEDIGSSDCVVNQFEHDIVHDGERYVSKLPFKFDHDYLPDNYNVCQMRLQSLKVKLEKQQVSDADDKV